MRKQLKSPHSNQTPFRDNEAEISITDLYSSCLFMHWNGRLQQGSCLIPLGHFLSLHDNERVKVRINKLEHNQEGRAASPIEIRPFFLSFVH